MPIRDAKKYTFRPKGLSDSQDGSNSFPGAMQLLQNLVPSPTTENVFVPRPAGQQVTNFSDFNTPETISALLILGSRAYGMIASNRFPGYDEPFCYDIANRVFIPIDGVTAANVPATQSSNGDWIPPTIVAVTNARILVTHPGFLGGAGPYFGWFDISSFVAGAIYGNTTAGSDVVRSIQNPTGTSAPILSGVQPGQTITGAGIPANDTVASAANGTFSVDLTGNTTSGNPTVTSLSGTTAGIEYGMQVASPAFPIGTYVIDSTSSTLTLSANATEIAASVAVDVSGGGTITLVEPATATANGVALAIAGGTLASPLWGAGNTNTYPLFKPPLCVQQFNSRAYFGVGNFLVFSDANNPTQITNANQALTLGDSEPITALAGLPYTNTVTGGVVAALIAFKGAETLFQITGDADSTSAPLQQNEVNGSVGTLAPNTICPTPLGLLYVATDGVRILGLTGQVSEPIGTNGKGVSVPFLNALNPSRMCAAYGQDVVRISVQNGSVQGQPYQEFWYDFDLKSWTGPHTFAASLIESYPKAGAAGGFIAAPVGVPAALFQSGVIPVSTSVYLENNVPLSWTYRPTLGPDNQEMANNQTVETSLMVALVQSDELTIQAINEFNRVIGSVTLVGYPSPSQSVWGEPTWGGFDWGQQAGAFVQYAIDWPEPLDFKQMSVEISGLSNSGQSIGNLYIKYQVTGYLTQGQNS